MSLVTVFLRFAFANSIALGLVQWYYLMVYPKFGLPNPYANGVVLLVAGAIFIACMVAIKALAPSNHIPLTSTPLDTAYAKLIAFFLGLDLFIVGFGRVLGVGFVWLDLVLVFTGVGAMAYGLPDRFRSTDGFRLSVVTGVGNLTIGAVLLIVAFSLLVSKYDVIFDLVNYGKEMGTVSRDTSRFRQLHLATVLAIAMLVTHLSGIIEILTEVLSEFFPFRFLQIILACSLGGVLAIGAVQLIPYTDATDLYWKAVLVCLAFVQPLFTLMMDGVREVIEA